MLLPCIYCLVSYELNSGVNYFDHCKRSSSFMTSNSSPSTLTVWLYLPNNTRFAHSRQRLTLVVFYLAYSQDSRPDLVFSSAVWNDDARGVLFRFPRV
jgi:hypothetical protein